MDLIQYTYPDYWSGVLTAKIMAPFIFGAIYGVLLGIGLAHKQWWVPVILILLPVVLTFVSHIIPETGNETFRLFFMGVPALAVIAFAVWLARTR